MAYFQNKNPDLAKFWMVLQCTMLVYYMSIWSISWLFGIFVAIWYILWFLVHNPRFGILYQVKSGNPA
jgi:hypothetical protein